MAQGKEEIQISIIGLRPLKQQKCVYILRFENADPQTFEVYIHFTIFFIEYIL